MLKKLSTILFFGILIFSSSSFAQAVKGKDEALETLGSTSALLLYNSYICIGSIADGLEVVNKKETAITLLSEQSNGMGVIINNYTKLLSSGFLDSENDQLFVKKIIQCAGYLKTEALSMKNYIESKSKADLEMYSSNRNNAWEVIEDVLGLKK